MIIIYRLFAPKSILETEKTLKTLSSGQIYKKKTKKPTGLVFFFFKPGFFQPWLKEAKSFLEAEKMRLEAGILEGEARAKEMEKTVVEGANRIAELGDEKINKNLHIDD